MERFTKKLIIGMPYFFALISFTSLNAAEPMENYAAKISFPNTDDSKKMVYNAHLDLARIDLKLINLQNLILEALDISQSSDDRYHLNQEFQAGKYKLEKDMKSMTAWFHAFSEHYVLIEIKNEESGNQLQFKLPKLTLSGLGIKLDTVDTVENAQMALNHLNEAAQKINRILPSNTQPETLDKFIADRELSGSKTPNKFYIASADDSTKLLESMVRVNYQLYGDFIKPLKRLAVRATKSIDANERNRINIEFNNLKDYLRWALSKGYVIGGVQLFNGNQLVFKSNGKTQKYVFPLFDLKTINLDSDVISDNHKKNRLALSHVDQGFNWMSNWLVSGDDPLKTLTIPTHNDEFKHLKLSEEQRRILQK